MWSLDGSAQNVGGPILTPDLDAVDGTLTPVPETDYVLAVNGVTLQARWSRSGAMPFSTGSTAAP